MSYRIVDNFLDKEDFDRIKKRLFEPTFRWTFSAVTVMDLKSEELNKKYVTPNHFVHNFYRIYHPKLDSEPVIVESEEYDLMTPCLNRFEELEPNKNFLLLRIGANYLPHVEALKNNVDIPHADNRTADGYACLLYLNDSGGDTILYNQLYTGEEPKQFDILTRIEPKENRFVYWDIRRYHSAPSSGNQDRIVINFNFEEEKP